MELTFGGARALVARLKRATPAAAICAALLAPSLVFAREESAPPAAQGDEPSVEAPTIEAPRAPIPADALFERANNAYIEGRFEAAADLYRKLAASGYSDPRLEYNLGNAEFKTGRKGPAILHWERALKLDPADRDARRNLEYARAFLADRVETPPVPGWLSALRERQHALGLDAQAWSAVALVWALTLVLAWSLSAPGRWRPAWGWTLAGLALFLALVGGSWWATWERVEGRERAVVLTPTVDLLAGPGPSNATIDRVHEGLAVEIRERREEWVQVSLPNGLSGWLPQAALGEV